MTEADPITEAMEVMFRQPLEVKRRRGMKKLLKVTNVELRPHGDFVTLCLDDYTPDVEQVDPRKEKLALMKQQFEAAGAKEVGNMLEALGGLVDIIPQDVGGLSHSGHREIAKIGLTIKEYEKMGRPTVGDLVSADFTPGKAPEEKKV